MSSYFQIMMDKQSESQAREFLQWRAWCRVANTKLTNKKIEIGIGSEFNENRVLVGPEVPEPLMASTEVLASAKEHTSFLDVLTQNESTLCKALGQDVTSNLLSFLRSDEARALYELELLAGVA